MNKIYGKFLDIDLSSCSIRLQALSDLAESVCDGNVVIFYADSEGIWGSWLKSAGYDALAVRGSAEIPVYLSVSKNRVSIKKAENIWSSDSETAKNQLKEIEGGHFKALCFGPSGYSKTEAVLRSKNLKAVIVKGGHDLKRTGRAPVKPSEGFQAIIK